VESNRQLDPARRASFSRALILFVFLFLCLPLSAQQDATTDVTARMQQLLVNEQWQAIVDIATSVPNRTAEIEYIEGIAFAKLGRLREAQSAFLHGQQLSPNDPRFPLELGGIAFKEKRLAEATRWLRRAVSLAPDDKYANDFLGTVYFLLGNQEASLKYWNRNGRPRIESVRSEPKLSLDPVIFDRAIDFAPGTILTPQQLLNSEARLKGLGVLPVFKINLQARPNGSFDAVVQAKESNGFGANKWVALLNTFRGIIFETVTPEYYNIHGSATSVLTMYRWDVNKRRVLASVGGPVRRDPRWHYRLAFDFRNENWALKNFSGLPTASLGGLNFRRTAGTAEIASLRSATWNWSTGAEFSDRDFRSVIVNPTLPASLFLGGKQLKHFARIGYEFLRIPERRFTTNIGLATQEGRTWNSENPAFAKVQLGSRQHWYPQASGDDYEIQSQVRYGRTYGDVPFDELFMLGIERDNDLMMRAHVGADDGKKGTAPLGRNYFLTNWELDKNIYGNSLFRLTVGPFVDIGKITDPDPSLGTRKWLFDTGVQVKIRTFGMRFAITYGKDLRTGNNEAYIYLTQ